MLAFALPAFYELFGTTNVSSTLNSVIFRVMSWNLFWSIDLQIGSGKQVSGNSLFPVWRLAQYTRSEAAVCQSSLSPRCCSLDLWSVGFKSVTVWSLRLGSTGGGGVLRDIWEVVDELKREKTALQSSASVKWYPYLLLFFTNPS